MDRSLRSIWVWRSRSRAAILCRRSAFRRRSVKTDGAALSVALPSSRTAIAELQLQEGLGLKEMIKCLSFHEKLKDLALRSKTAPWFGILCDPIHGKVRRQKRYEALCVEMMIYLLGGAVPRREKLRGDFFEARRGQPKATRRWLAICPAA